ncbi:MAG: hypothetical protein E7426_07220 [Ruminococcaceae bacterium]|nr:hypothetical protein [Oscillospiraceae bacterium]
MRTLIKNGLLIDPANRVRARLNLVLEEGKVALVTAGEPRVDRVIDAAGKVVCPGFVDIHMHEDPVEPDGTIYADGERAIFRCMLRMGVTTVLAGQCGQNVCHPADYLDIVDRCGAAVNVAMLAGHGWFRRYAGATDKYKPTTPAQNAEMAAAIAAALDRGVLGVSYGIRYIPGLSMEELLATAAPCKKDGKLIAAHIRSDAEEVFDAARELLETGRIAGVPVQVSHIGSMAGFGQMERFLNMVDTYRLNGLDVSCDCYPYYAFSTHLGSTTYDEGWLERYRCGYDAVELCEGPYRGQRCTKEIFEEERSNNPDCITVCYVMQETDVDMAFRHPNVMLASDGIMNHGQGHPRAAGTFPRLLGRFVRTGKLDLYDAIDRMTAMPAERLHLAGKGRLNRGADADVVIFDPERIEDRATFDRPLLPPAGIDYVLLGGEIAVVGAEIVRGDLGRAVRK